MPDINAGHPLRFENGGVVLIGTDSVLNIREGTLKFTAPGYEPIPHMDKGALVSVHAGNERPCRVELDLKYTSTVDANGVLASLTGALVSTKIRNRLSDGQLFTFGLTIRVPDAPGATTGDQYVFEKCYCDNPLDVQCNAGADFDTLRVAITSHALSPAITRYS